MASDLFSQAWESREWGIDGIVEEACARRWFEKGVGAATMQLSDCIATKSAQIAGYIDQHGRDSAELRRLCAERDEAKDRIKALEAKCALLAASLAQEESRSAELQAQLEREHNRLDWLIRQVCCDDIPSIEIRRQIDVFLAANKGERG